MIETNNQLHPLETFGMVYLASPYTNYPLELTAAYQDVRDLAAKLALKGLYNIYSPIVYSHALCGSGLIDKLDHDFWMQFDQAQMNKADALLVAQLPGWQISKGITQEIGIFRGKAKPILFLEPVELFVSVRPIMTVLERRVA